MARSYGGIVAGMARSYGGIVAGMARSYGGIVAGIARSYGGIVDCGLLRRRIADRPRPGINGGQACSEG
jgi:hypothetical protein